jgi:hypothetical protein
MARRSVTVDGNTLLVNFDEPPAQGSLNWAMLRARLFDELTGQAPVTTAFITGGPPQVRPRVASGGIVGLVGVPQKATPRLATQPYAFDVTMGAAGYLSFERRVTMPAQPGFPATFTPADLGALPLHRTPTTIRGRLMLEGGAGRTPIAGGLARVRGVWRTTPPPNVSVAADPPNLVSLYPPVSFPRASGIGRLRRRDMQPVLGQDKTLNADASAGSDLLLLTNWTGLTTASILMIEPQDTARREIIGIAGIDGEPDPALPARVTLDQPLTFTHRSGALVRRATPQVAGQPMVVSADVIEGDTTVYVGTLNVPNGVIVEVAGGPQPTEYRVASLYEAQSDGDGYYRLPPLSRVAQLELEASDGGIHPAVTSVRTPNYGVPENVLDLVLV